jgi:eukaryotic-like serine/threonine-protein kinase
MSKADFEDLEGLEDSYDQIRKMAIGGMAEVYRGRQKNLDRPVAIKRMRPELVGNKDLQERFRREARASANLLHQNLAHVYDFRTVGQEAYIIMEWIDGFDLAQLLERTGALPPDVAAMIALKILHGLSYVHAHGMIHRDLKPDNVRISTRGEVKIMDFGIAFDPSEQNLTMPGVLIGSPHYLSPEQVTGAKLDTRADLFSFGITFYEMLTGKKPFFETQNESVYSRIQKGEYINPLNIKEDIPVFFTKVLEQCLQVKAERRPSGATRVATGLGEFLARNYSLDSEARIRKFLLEKKLMPGNADLIEVGSPTLSGVEGEFFGKIGRRIDESFSGHGLRNTLIVALLLGLALVGWNFRAKVAATFLPNSASSLTAPAAEAPAVVAPTPAAKPKPAPRLPGKAVN